MHDWRQYVLGHGLITPTMEQGYIYFAIKTINATVFIDFGKDTRGVT